MPRGKYSEQQKKATDKFVKANYDSIIFRVRKGKKDKIKGLASLTGESVNALMLRLVEQEAERLGYDMTTPPTPSQQRKGQEG